MNVSNGLAVSFALSLSNEAVNSKCVSLDLIRYVKSVNDVLNITHVSVMMIVVFFVLMIVVMVVLMLMFVGMLVFMRMRMCMLLVNMLVMVLFMMMLMHVLIFFNTVNRNMCVGAFDTAFDALFEVIGDSRNAK